MADDRRRRGSQPRFHGRTDAPEYASIVAARRRHASTASATPSATPSADNSDSDDSSEQSGDDAASSEAEASSSTKRRRSEVTPVVVTAIGVEVKTAKEPHHIKITLRGAIESFATFAEVSSDLALTEAASLIRSARPLVIARINQYFETEDIDDATFRATSYSKFSADILPTLQQAVPAAALRSRGLSAKGQQRDSEGPAHNTILAIHVVHNHVEQKHYHKWASELLPSPPRAYDATTSPFGVHIPHAPSRIVYRLSQSMLDHDQLPDLVVSADATPSRTISPHPRHLPVRFAKKNGQGTWKQRDLHLPIWASNTSEVEACASSSWQARLLQETVRRRRAGDTPQEAADFFYGSIASDPISPPFLPQIVDPQAANQPEGFVVRFTHSQAHWPARTFASRPIALAEARRLTSALLDAEKKYGRRWIEEETNARSIVQQWYDDLVNAVPAAEASRLLGNKYMARLVREEGSAPGCGAEFCEHDHHLCQCGTARNTLHPYDASFRCDEMDGDVALTHIIQSTVEALVSHNAIQVDAAALDKYDKNRSFAGDQPIRTTAAAAAQPATILGLPGANEEALASLVDAVRRSTSRVDHELAHTASEVLNISVDVFMPQPFDGHTSTTVRVVRGIVLALSPSLDLTVHFDEREGSRLETRLAHTEYSSRRIPSWGQSRKTRNLALVINILAGLHIKNAGLESAVEELTLRELDAIMPASRDVDIAYGKAGRDSGAYLDDDFRQLARELTSLIEVQPPTAAPALVAAVTASSPSPPNIDKMIESYHDWYEEKWADEQGCGKEVAHNLRKMIRKCRRGAEMIEQLCDPSTPAGKAYRQRVAEIEVYYGKCVPKTPCGFPLLGFATDPKATPKKMCRLAHGALGRMVFTCNKEVIVECGGIDVKAKFPFSILLDVWCVEFIKFGGRDARCGLTHDLSGDLTSMKPCMAAAKRHHELMWDGKTPPVAEIEHLNITMQPTALNDILESKHFSVLDAILVTTQRPICEYLTRLRSLDLTSLAQSSIDGMATVDAEFNDEAYEWFRGNGFFPSDIDALEALWAQGDDDEEESD